MTTLAAPRKLEIKDFKSDVPADWCPGCGDFGVLNALQRACAELGVEPHELLVVSGIGCSSNLPGFFRSYGVHSLHGRALPFATGAKLANHALTVVATGGDGDGYGIGLNHLIHAMRRNINLTYVVMNNEIYGLTTGQMSPTSEHGMVTKSTPGGNLEQMLGDGQGFGVGAADPGRAVLPKPGTASVARSAGPGPEIWPLARASNRSVPGTAQEAGRGICLTGPLNPSVRPPIVFQL
jgi:hypothetical protein